MLLTSARLLRLLSLLQVRRFWSGADLAERLEVTGRTLRRDVDRLRSLGYPVHSTSGVAGGYQLGAGAALPPLQLDDDEALAVSIALGSVAAQSVSGIDEAAVRALVKLEQVLPVRLRRRADALRATIVPLQRTGTSVRATLLSTLAGACRDHTEVSFGYADARGRASERRVEPLGLVHTSYRWYLVAWDVGRADYRTFRVDRIAGEPAAGASFAPRPPPEGGDLRTYVSRSLSTAAYGAQASVILHAPYASIAERVSPSAVLLERLDAGRCRLTLGAHSMDSLAAWILMLGVDFEIETPEELREQVRVLHARLGRVLRTRQARARSSRRPKHPPES
jgi:predicted DNA-binding transcriptional regulator YafY